MDPSQLAVDHVRPSSVPLASSPPFVAAVSCDDTDSEHMGGSDSDSARPRFQGQWHAYRRYIRDERRLDASLAKLRGDDLSVHLYNAYALKRCVRDAAAAEETTQDEGSMDETTSKKDRWMPSRRWTAWPMEPTAVPGLHERFASRPYIDPTDTHTFRRPGHDRQRPIRDIKEIVVGLVQRRARAQWDESDWGDDTDSDTAPTFPFSRREFILDDESAYETLRPSSQSIVRKLNDVLLDVHERRRGRGRDVKPRKTKRPLNETESSRSLDAQGQGRCLSSNTVKRGRGRPPKPSNQATRLDSTSYVVDGEIDASSSTKNRRPGRPIKLERLPGESYYMMRKRRAILGDGGQPPDQPSKMRIPEPEPAPDSPRSPTPRRSRSRLPPEKDWRDILLTAIALRCFSEAAIERTASRCAELFGDSITLPTPHGHIAVGNPATATELVKETTLELDSCSTACPHSGCRRQTRPYNSRWRLREHVKKKHGYRLDVPRKNARGGRKRSLSTSGNNKAQQGIER